MNHIIILLFVGVARFCSGQVLEIDNSIENIEVKESTDGFQLLRSNDTINPNIKKPLLNNSTLFRKIKVYTRSPVFRDRSEIIVEYSYSHGSLYSIRDESLSQIIVLDSASGMELFSCVNNRMCFYGTDWAEYLQYSAYSYDVQFNADGSINICNIEQNGLPASMLLGDPDKLRADKEEGKYVYRSGKYVYVNQ